MQPLLLVFVFTYVFPKIGQGVGGSRARSDVLELLVAGVVAIACIFQGIQAVALPLVQEFGYTREIEDRVMAPLPVWGVAAEKIVAGALQGLLAAFIVFPLAHVDPGHGRAPGRALAGAGHVAAARHGARRRARPDHRHRVHPSRCRSCSAWWSSRSPSSGRPTTRGRADADPVAQGGRAAQPTRLHAECIRRQECAVKKIASLIAMPSIDSEFRHLRLIGIGHEHGRAARQQNHPHDDAMAGDCRAVPIMSASPRTASGRVVLGSR